MDAVPLQQLWEWRYLAAIATRPSQGVWDNEKIAANEQLSKQAHIIIPALLAEVERLQAELTRERDA